MSPRPPDRCRQFRRLTGPAGVVDPQQSGTGESSDRARRHGGLPSLVLLQPKQATEEDLVAGRQQQRVSERGEPREGAQQLERLAPCLAEVQARIEDDAFARQSGVGGPHGHRGEGVGDVQDHVVVDGVGIGDLRGEADVRRDDGSPGASSDVEVPGVPEAAHVVAQDRPGLERHRRDVRPPGVDGHRHVETLAQGGHRVADQGHLLLGRDVVNAHPAGTRANLQDVGTVGDKSLRAHEQGIQIVVGPAVVERVAGAVEDAHDEGATVEVEDVATEVELHAVHRRQPPPGPEAGDTGRRTRRLIITAAGPTMAPLTRWTVPTHRALGDRHGYEQVTHRIRDGHDRSSTAVRAAKWAKVRLLREALEEHDLVLWLDADAIVRKFDRDPADDLPADAFQGLVLETFHDRCNPNTGVWLLRRDARSMAFIDEVSAIGQLDHSWADQAAVCHLLGWELGDHHGHGARRARPTAHTSGTSWLPPPWNVVGTTATPATRIQHLAGLPLADRVRHLQSIHGELRAAGRLPPGRGP